jgi:sarcinarray family protein
MKCRFSILILALFFLNFQIAAGAENEYGIVRAWFNGENATVEGMQLKIGETVDVKVEVISKISGDISLKLKEPGTTQAFNVLNGPSKQDEWIDSKIENGLSKTYTWTISPNGAWKNGNAPLNIFVQFNKGMNNKKIQFTIANPYILDEQYSGAVTTTTGAPKITETGAQAKATPFLPAIVTISALLLAWRLKKA